MCLAGDNFCDFTGQNGLAGDNFYNFTGQMHLAGDKNQRIFSLTHCKSNKYTKNFKEKQKSYFKKRWSHLAT
jgi:hypothetical protein